MIPWIKDGDLDDIVVSSRIRLARNFNDVNFPPIMDEAAQDRVFDRMKEELTRFGGFTFVRMNELSATERNALLEEHLASRELIKNPHGGLAQNEDDSLVIMINEEDHLRIQSLISGLALDEALEKASTFAGSLKMDFAYDDELGYLTACPTNTGTGMRASIMLHLPSIMMTGQMQNISSAITKMGMTIRGVYGEGSKIMGNMVQLSNQITLGLTEKEIVENLKAISKKIIDNERTARNILMDMDRENLEDKIFRALGILKYARTVTSGEMVELLSDVKLGVALGLVHGVSHSQIHDVMMEGKPNLLQVNAGTSLDEKERDIYRAELIREALQKAEE